MSDDDEDADAMFKMLTAGLELAEPTNVLDVTSLSDLDLMSRWQNLRVELLVAGEMFHASTDQGRDLHSQRAAVRIEMLRRNLLDPEQP